MKTLFLLCLGSLLSAAIPLQAAGLTVDMQRSRIQVDAKATGHSFTGNLTSFTVKAAGNETTNEPTAFEISWHFKNLDTADEKRDKEMISWLGGGDPKGSFKFIKFWTNEAGKSHAQGELTINGVSQVIAFPYTVTRDGEWVTIEGKARLNYESYKLPLIRTMAVMTVDPEVLIRFHIVGKVG